MCIFKSCPGPESAAAPHRGRAMLQPQRGSKGLFIFISLFFPHVNPFFPQTFYPLSPHRSPAQAAAQDWVWWVPPPPPLPAPQARTSGMGTGWGGRTWRCHPGLSQGGWVSPPSASGSPLAGGQTASAPWAGTGCARPGPRSPLSPRGRDVSDPEKENKYLDSFFFFF